MFKNKAKFALAASGTLAAAMLTSTPAFATNGYFASGYGIKSDGVAGAGIAFPQDSLTVATNPAGLVDVNDAFDIGLDVFVPQRSATLVQGGEPTTFDGDGVSTFYIPNIGYGRHLSPDLAVGIALFGNGGLNTDFIVNPFGRFGAQGVAGVDLEQAFLSPAIAYRIAAGQTLGLAVNIAYQRFKAKGIGLFGGFSSDPEAVSNRGYDSSTGAGARLGWTGHFGPYLTLGATWQSKTAMGRFKDYAGLFADRGGFDVPSTYGLGLALTPNSDWTVAFDWQKIDYSDVAAVGDGIASLFAGVPLGAENGPGFGWRDVAVFKLGVNFRVNEQLTLRAGASTNRQPIPASQTFFNVLAPGVVETHLAFGGTWHLDPRNSIEVSYQHAFQRSVDGSGSIPQAFGGGEVNLSLEEDVVGVGYSYQF
jgi:long-chain fatty acid transport protein